MGTQHKPPTPTMNTIFRSLLPNSPTSEVPASELAGRDNSPFSMYCRINAGIIMETTDGINISLITPAAVIVPAFHNIIVVTSPIGENAPPELAATMTSAA